MAAPGTLSDAARRTNAPPASSIVPPTRRWRPHAESEAQGRLGDDGARHAERRLTVTAENVDGDDVMQQHA